MSSPTPIPGARPAARAHQVVVFTTPTCSWCKRLKSYLADKKVKFREVDVSRDMQAAIDIVRRTGQRGVPVTLIDNRPIVGFDKPQIDRLLGLM
jgi:glutaredoxin-like YruB-family protein